MMSTREWFATWQFTNNQTAKTFNTVSELHPLTLLANNSGNNLILLWYTKIDDEFPLFELQKLKMAHSSQSEMQC